ncbi:MAG: hypothetical protein Q7K21_08315 [Elusimicrobiota bacterium]|nr:hypothetical protein [Elusimicrobiota bacterium]
MKLKLFCYSFLIILPLAASSCTSKNNQDLISEKFNYRINKLKAAFPEHFLKDVAISLSKDIERSTVFGEPNPPEGFAGPDPAGKHRLGIYVPYNYEKWNVFSSDISLEQWIFHEMFHLHNRRTGKYNKFIAEAFPDDNDPLVQWMKKDRYHRTFAKEEAFINLITFADPVRTKNQNEAVRKFFDVTGAKNSEITEIKNKLNVIPH